MSIVPRGFLTSIFVLASIPLVACLDDAFTAGPGMQAVSRDAAGKGPGSSGARSDGGRLDAAGPTNSDGSLGSGDAGRGPDDGGSAMSPGDAGTVTSDSGTVVPVADASCSAPETFYPDGDGDGVGRTSGAVTSCEEPQGDFSRHAGDCNDDNPEVYPDQAEYFSEPYVGSGGELSYDYDCSGEEEGDPSQVGRAPACGSFAPVNCSGMGYVPTERNGPRQSSICGSTVIRTCEPSSLLCQASEENVDIPKRCR